MDFAQFDQRGRAEAGVLVQLHNPYDKAAKLEDDNGPCGFMVRGIASKSVQQRLAAMQKKAEADAGADENAAMERLHQNQIESAMGFIIEPVNISIDGKPATGAEGIRRILDMTFPDLRLVRDEDGNPIMTTAKNDEGQDVQVPKFELANDTFAGQVIKAAEDGARFLGKTSNA